MAKTKLIFNDTRDRDRLRPSKIASLLTERDWLSELKMKLGVQESYACTPEQTDVILEIAVQNGFVESEYRKKTGWWYRVVELANAEETPKLPKGELNTGAKC